MIDIINDFINTYSTEIIGGLIVSLLILLFNKISDFEKNIRITRKYSGYVGNYFLYSFSSSGKDQITTTKVSIKPRFGKLTANANNGGIYLYSGSVHITERNIYINFDGINHIEKVQLIYYSPLHRKIKNLVGSINAISVIDEPFSSICILSDKELTEKNIRSVFKENGVTHENSMFKIPKNYSIYFDNIEEHKDIESKKKI